MVKENRKKENRIKSSPLFTTLTVPLQHFQILLFSNFLLFYLYNILTINFSGNFSLLKLLFSNFSCLLTSAISLLSNLAITSFVFFKSSSLSYMLHSTINLSIFISFNYFTFCLSTDFLYFTTQLTFITEFLLKLVVLI